MPEIASVDPGQTRLRGLQFLKSHQPYDFRILLHSTLYNCYMEIEILIKISDPSD